MSPQELERLVADRPEKTVEQFNPNDFYGHATVLKRYCGLPETFCLPGIHPHGPSINDFVWDYEIKHRLQHLFLVSEIQRPLYAKVSAKPATVIGSPFYYVVRLMETEVNDLRRAASGTIVFPFHSTHHVTVHYDEDAFLTHLKGLPAECSPVVVCMYWRDVQLGRHKPYLDAGFEVATAGHMFDHEFLYRFIRLVAARKRCLTNELGTCVFYSAALDLPVTIFRQNYRFAGADAKMLADADSVPNLPLTNRFLGISADPSPGDIAEQKKLAQEAMGYDYVRRPEELRALFESLAGIQENVSKPPWMQRLVQRFKRKPSFS